MAVNLSPIGGVASQFFDNNGDPLSGGKLFTYAAGTTTPQTTYTSSTGVASHTNPIILDAAGRVPGGEIWLTEAVQYKFVVKTSTDVQIGSYDNIVGINPQTYDNATQIIYDPPFANSVSTNVATKLSEAVSVKDFGAVGDGLTNDTDAFAATAAYINARGGGIVIIPPGTYIVGKQTFAGASGLGYSYKPADILKFQNCTLPVIVFGYGATLKAANGLRIGSFNPITGAAYIPPSLPFLNSDYLAGPYWGMIEAVNNTCVAIYGLELDGNISSLTIGGEWGDTGRQCPAYGVRAYGNQQLIVENVYTHHHGLDGIIIGWQGLTTSNPPYPHTLNTVRSEYNARQGLSWVGGNNLTAIGCSFSYTGRSTFSSAPTAGVDVEAELSICRNGTFINCQILDNAGVGFLAAVGDNASVSCQSCHIVGTSNYSMWPDAPYFSFSDCLIVGTIVNAYGSTSNPGSAAKFTRCIFTNNPIYAPNIYVASATTGLANLGGDSQNVLFRDCIFEAYQSAIGNLNATTLDSCTIEQRAGTTYLPSGDNFIIGFGTTFRDCRFLDGISGDAPALPYYINITPSTLFLGQNTFPTTGNLRVFSPFEPNQTDLAQSARRPFGSIMLAEAFESVTKDKKLIAYGSAAPISGSYTRGDIIFNNAPSASGRIGWVCVSSGTPGTWKTFGAIDA